MRTIILEMKTIFFLEKTLKNSVYSSVDICFYLQSLNTIDNIPDLTDDLIGISVKNRLLKK